MTEANTQITHPFTHAHEVRNEVRNGPPCERSVGWYVRSVVPRTYRHIRETGAFPPRTAPKKRALVVGITLALAA